MRGELRPVPHGGGTPTARVSRRGVVRLAIPDPIRDPVYIFDQLTWDRNRDLASFVKRAVGQTARLADGVLDAFSAEAAIFEAAAGPIPKPSRTRA
jgi:hypothetical protein